jgi:hypothetical protein
VIDLVRVNDILPEKPYFPRIFSALPNKKQRRAGNVGQALGYTLNQWDKIRHCLSQGVLEIDTNLVEAIKRLPPDATPDQAAALTPARIAAKRRAKAADEEVA